ncbi:uncharacterized protein A4U43_C04F11990 [Asparagus officinalis]|uniref:Uncharacterized protein n=1 Tax=Asparagus officinalis TaxID=4686 RepID=A0A5P1F511_ASPOF|nr:acidic leucine-rich nuclear phosphoprotein 32 family member A-like [Asparagus officinalis]ONK71751.1 uncharacterized protein A4U43_C04F11990 [Asparagus officinalis]
METPSSMRRVARSQTSIASQKIKKENSERSALLDITNESPIVGLAAGTLLKKTPSSSAIKTRVCVENEPGSGEDLLRGQVKNLLQKVEEEDGHVSVDENSLKIEPIQIAEAIKPEEAVNPQENLLNRALLFDSPEKSLEDDSSSAWSIQVNVSIQDEEEEKIEDFDGEEEEEEEEEEYYEEAENYFDDICQGLSKMTVKEEKFEGKHTRFVYNSDDEIEGEEVIQEKRAKNRSPSALLLRGLPVPEGKHLRFHDEEDEE